jgi:ribosomal-protein-alanine N-acetyltransferase
VLSIEREAFNENNPYMYVKLYELHSDWFLVVENGNTIVGYVISALTNDYEGRILSFAVQKDFRGRGIGRELMDKILDLFKEEGIHHVKLEVRLSNEISQSLYRNLGFIETNYIPGYYSDGEGAIVMEKYLP